MTGFGVAGLMFLGVALACNQSTANAQSNSATSDEIANHGGLTARKVRVILPSPYRETDITAKSSKAIWPAALDTALVTKPALPVAESPNTKALTVGQPVQASTSTAPAATQAEGTFRKPPNQVNTPTDDSEAGKHDLNIASLVDLNSLEGGGMIGRAIIAGRPYRSSDELVTRRILTRATYERIKAQVNVPTTGDGHVIPPVT